MISYNYIYILKEHSDTTKETINIYKTESESFSMIYPTAKQNILSVFR